MARSMPPLIRPMLATLGPPPTGAGWGWEWKWDGVRAVAYLDGAGRVRLMSRNDIDMAPSYPDLAGIGAVGEPMVLDGEIVAVDKRGAPSFARLQNRMHVRAPSAALVRGVPVRFYLFDVMWLAGRDLTNQPYTARRARLDELVLPAPAEIPPAFVEGGVDAEDLLTAAEENGLEGVIAKRLTSPYRAGKRSPDWVKTPIGRTQEVVVVGWRPGAGRRAGMIGSLILAVPTAAGELAYAGHVGTGFTAHMLRDLARRLAPLQQPRSPIRGAVPADIARDARWVQPRLVAEVQYRNWSPDGRLRHPSYRGLRPDKDPGDIHRHVP